MAVRAKGLGRALTARASFEDEHRSRLLAKTAEIEDGALSELRGRQLQRAAWREEKAIRAEIRRQQHEARAVRP